MASDTQIDTSDNQTLIRLNQEYAAAMKADVEWYREHLADEFVRSRQSNAT